ncbi:MAG: hypothetical protein D3917_06495 [Candidatus Electrothrix sp. AX5]|nr:hypothetical protein [Candidatus Electrothrix sp. AX5]
MAPGIIDLDNADSSNGKWQLYNERTKLLVLGVDACHDILLYKDQVITPKTRQRAARGMTVPICKLIDTVLDIAAKMNDEQSRNIRKDWSDQDQKVYQTIAKKLRKVQHKSKIRYIRNKLGAHLDPKVFNDEHIPSIALNEILSIFGNALVLLMLFMNYPSTYFHWIRFLGNMPDGKHRTIETMFQYPLCISYLTDIDGHMKDMEKMTVAEDPRHEMQTQLLEATDSWNKIVKETDLEPFHLSFAPSEPLKKGTAPEWCLVFLINPSQVAQNYNNIGEQAGLSVTKSENFSSPSAVPLFSPAS